MHEMELVSIQLIYLLLRTSRFNNFLLYRRCIILANVAFSPIDYRLRVKYFSKYTSVRKVFFSQNKKMRGEPTLDIKGEGRCETRLHHEL